MIFCLLSTLLQLFNTPVVAQSNYSTSHEVVYFLSTEKTVVNHKVLLKIEDKYQGIQNLSFTEPGSNINDLVLVNNSLGAEIENNNAKIFINFINLVVGPKTEEIEFTYNSDNIFKKIGKTYVLDIPKVEDSEFMTEFNLKVYFPKSLSGLHNFNSNLKSDENGNYLVFSKEELKSFGETIIFGGEEFYDVKVTNIISKDKNYIVVPPSLKGRQEVYLKNISKSPSRQAFDIDGNHILYYKPKEIEKVTTEYLIKVYGNGQNQTNNLNFVNTKAIKNWDYENGYPKYLLSSHKGSKYELVNTFFNLTKETLSYSNEKANYDYINRIGSENLNEQNFNQAVCLEYSDLLISLLRGIDIPAREINGYALDTNNKEKSQLHSWVEYLDKEGSWKQVDPTWSDTSNQDYLNSFDLYHINFLIRGSNSETPILPGSYKIGVVEENVDVKVVQNTPEIGELKIKARNLGVITLIKNNSLNVIYVGNKTLKPGSWNLQKNENLNFNNSLFNVKTEGLTYSDFFDVNLLYVLPLFFAPLFFYLMHSKLKKISKGKDKIKSII